MDYKNLNNINHFIVMAKVSISLFEAQPEI